MSKHVLPHPPSPTTTNFFEYAGGCVILVAADTLSDELAALMVPLLFRVLCCLTGFR